MVYYVVDIFLHGVETILFIGVKRFLFLDLTGIDIDDPLFSFSICQFSDF